jgi:manganese/zinc/iron transport system permease protein
LRVSEVAVVEILADYNTRVVLAGTVLLGVTAGVVGVFMCLRRRALVGDVASHAALPGVAIAFLLQERWWPGAGRWLPGLLIGAGCSSALALLMLPVLQRVRRVKSDAALGVLLSLFFGAGVALLTVIQAEPSGQSAGLNDFVFGKASALLASDVALLAVASMVVLLTIVALLKEFGLLCFDSSYAGVLGLPVFFLDALLTVLVIITVVLGMQSVGLLLVVALLVIPPTAARFWTSRLSPMLMVAGCLGGLSAAVGVWASALVPKLAAGGIIVLGSSGLLAISALLGFERGWWWHWRADRQLQQRVGAQDLLRACYEVLEAQALPGAAPALQQSISVQQLQASRNWSVDRLTKLLSEAAQSGTLRQNVDGTYRLTSRGVLGAMQAVRNHRLWELYLLREGGDVPAMADRQADAVEHIVAPEVVGELESILQQQQPQLFVPPCPHREASASESASDQETPPDL